MRFLMIAVWIFMVAVTGYALFHITFQVEALEGELARLNDQIRDEQEKIHNLEAEWSYSTRPAWVETLGAEFLPEMERMQPAQIFKIEDIPFRRPEAPEAEAASDTGPTVPENAIPTTSGTIEIVPATLVRTYQ